MTLDQCLLVGLGRSVDAFRVDQRTEPPVTRRDDTLRIGIFRQIVQFLGVGLQVEEPGVARRRGG